MRETQCPKTMFVPPKSMSQVDRPSTAIRRAVHSLIPSLLPFCFRRSEQLPGSADRPLHRIAMKRLDRRATATPPAPDKPTMGRKEEDMDENSPLSPSLDRAGLVGRGGRMPISVEPKIRPI